MTQQSDSPEGNNPLEALAAGLGGLDLGGLMQQAQQMQAQLQEAQAKLADTVVDGSVAGGAVKVSVTGTGEVTAVAITADAVDGTDEQALAELGDLIVAAYRDAKSKADDLAEQMLGPVAGGLAGPGEAPPSVPGQLGFT